ncbi:MAG: hypothetical protein RLY93_01970 [Sumerlaeia bacterium]
MSHETRQNFEQERRNFLFQTYAHAAGNPEKPISWLKLGQEIGLDSNTSSMCLKFLLQHGLVEYTDDKDYVRLTDKGVTYVETA